MSTLRKKFLVSLLAGMLSLGVVACGGNDDPADPDAVTDPLDIDEEETS